MLKRQKRQNRVKYHKGDYVLVRLFKRNSNHLVQVAKGIVSMSDNFKVKVTYTFDNVERTGMFTLDHVSMLKTSKELRRERRQKYILQDPEAIFKNQGFCVAFDPTPDGSCMFSAMVHQLRQCGIERSSLTLRQEIVKEISQNRTKYESFVVGSFDLYIHQMLQPTTFGDHLCLQAAGTGPCDPVGGMAKNVFARRAVMLRQAHIHDAREMYEFLKHKLEKDSASCTCNGRHMR